MLIRTTLAAMAIATTVNAQSLPTAGQTSFCDESWEAMGLLILPEALALSRHYPDNNLEQISEWIGNAMFDDALMSQIDPAIARSLNGKTQRFVDMLAILAEAGCLDDAF